MCNLPNLQAEDLKELSCIKKGQTKFVDFVMPAGELLVEA